MHLHLKNLSNFKRKVNQVKPSSIKIAIDWFVVYGSYIWLQMLSEYLQIGMYIEYTRWLIMLQLVTKKLKTNLKLESDLLDRFKQHQQECSYYYMLANIIYLPG